MKIAILGGGGVRTVLFTNGLIQWQKDKYKQDIEISLYDTDKSKLNIIGSLCRCVTKKNNMDKQIKIVISGSSEDAITNADYVVTTLRVGGDHARVIDETVAAKRGVLGQETTGIGGFSMAVRTIPVLLSYCDMVKRLAPNALIFNFTNPSGLVTQALHDAGYSNVIGICDAPSSTKFRMAEYLKVDEKDLYVEFYGLNHLSWIRKVQKNGQEILPSLVSDSDFLNNNPAFSVFDKELIKAINSLPNEYMYYYYHRERALENLNNASLTRGMSIENNNRLMMSELSKMDIENNPEEALQTFLYYMTLRENSYMQAEAGLNVEEVKRGNLEMPEGIGYAGVMLDCIEALNSDTGMYLTLCVPNKGCMKQLKDSDIVEVTCKVDRNGIKPVSIGEIPDLFLPYVVSVKTYERLTVEALKNNSRETAILALSVHPQINSYSLAAELLNDYEKAYNTQFFGHAKE